MLSFSFPFNDVKVFIPPHDFVWLLLFPLYFGGERVISSVDSPEIFSLQQFKENSAPQLQRKSMSCRISRHSHGTRNTVLLLFNSFTVTWTNHPWEITHMFSSNVLCSWEGKILYFLKSYVQIFTSVLFIKAKTWGCGCNTQM